MSQNRNFKVGFFALAFLEAIPFQSNFVRADDGSTPSATASPAPSAEDGYSIEKLQLGTEISIPLNAEVPTGEDLHLGSAPDVYNPYLGSCDVVLSPSSENREINGTLFITVTSIGCGNEGGASSECHSEWFDDGVSMFGVTTFNGIPQKGDTSLYCHSQDISIGDFKALIQKNGGTFKSPGPVSVQQL
jgi:hypothetical protein